MLQEVLKLFMLMLHGNGLCECYDKFSNCLCKCDMIFSKRSSQIVYCYMVIVLYECYMVWRSFQIVYVNVTWCKEVFKLFM
jgi:hypothetical protein